MSEVSTVEITLFVLGTLLAIIGFLAVYILNSIKEEIKDLKDGISEINQDLRDGVTGLDRRVTTVEAHLGFSTPSRRKSNGHAEVSA